MLQGDASQKKYSKSACGTLNPALSSVPKIDKNADGESQYKHNSSDCIHDIFLD